MTAITTEVELCERVIAWLKAQHWEVYQEVSMGYGSHRADIVAALGPTVWIIEAKRGLSLALIDQALAWRGYAHLVSIATLSPKSSPRYALHWFCKTSGVGWITVRKDYDEINNKHSPRLMRDSRMVDHLRTKLREEQKVGVPAGSKVGGYWTPYSETCRAVLSRVRNQPGLTMKELMNNLNHHYSTDALARRCLAHWADEGKIKGVRLERDGRLIRLYPEKIEPDSNAEEE